MADRRTDRRTEGLAAGSIGDDAMAGIERALRSEISGVRANVDQLRQDVRLAVGSTVLVLGATLMCMVAIAVLARKVRVIS